MDITSQFNQWHGAANEALNDLPRMIDQLDWRVAVVLLPLGIVSLLFGYKIFKAVVILYCGVVGALIGWWLTIGAFHSPEWWWVGALVGGGILALIAWPLVNFFVGFWGAVAGGLLGHVLVQAMGDPAITLIGVVVGVVLGAILALLIFRIMIILTTSVVGANMAVIGALALLLHVTSIAEPLRRWLGSTHYMLPLLVAVPAFVGVVYQLYRTESKGKKEPGTAKEEE